MNNTQKISFKPYNKGITLISLVITIVIILILTSITVSTSTNRFKINNLNKMYNDIDLLNDKISSYYLQYGGLPILKDSNNNNITYTFTQLNFIKNANDDTNYYIIDLGAIGNITLNYGEEGYKNPNTSDDVYIINNKTHTIYYVKGIEFTDGNLYYSKGVEDNSNKDTVPPTKPNINIIEGTLDKNNENNNETTLYYITSVLVEFVPGKDNWSGISKTTYSINDSAEIDISTLTKNQYTITDNGSYEITLKSYDNNNNFSTTKLIININK